MLVVGAGVVVVAVLAALARPLERRSTDEQEANAETAALATDFAAGIRVLAGLGTGKSAAERYRRQSRLALDRTVRASVFSGGLTAVTSLVVGLYLAAVGAVAGTLALDSGLSLGDLIATLGLAQFLADPSDDAAR